MKLRFFVIAVCFAAAPASANADDYKRKDYRDSYERHYERVQPDSRSRPRNDSDKWDYQYKNSEAADPFEYVPISERSREQEPVKETNFFTWLENDPLKNFATRSPENSPISLSDEPDYRTGYVDRYGNLQKDRTPRNSYIDKDTAYNGFDFYKPRQSSLNSYERPGATGDDDYIPYRPRHKAIEPNSPFSGKPLPSLGQIQQMQMQSVR